MLSDFRIFGCVLFALTFLFAESALAQTGKISGTVTDAESGEPLPGVNVVVQGEQIGTSTNANGRYVILNIPPGTYNVTASFVGYAQQTVQGVDVNIDLTTQVDFELQEQTAELQEVTVQAEERVVKADVSSSRIDIGTEDMESLPMSSLSEVVGLQAGIQGDLEIRGGGRDAVNFMVDGASQTGMRDGQPFTQVSFTGVKEVQVQTGGFSAEYGNLRSGLINVVTREGPRNRYTVDLLGRYRPPQQKNFGPHPDSPEAYWVRPYLDPEVKWKGTSAWSDSMRAQYPDFDGYEAIARSSLADDNPDNDLTPKAAEQLFRWRHRRDLSIRKPDYVIDGSFGGPVPAVGSALGGLRFFASYRREQEQYVIPLSRRGYDAQIGRIKLTSNPTTGVKLNLTGMTGFERGTRTGSRVGVATTVRRDQRQQIRTSYRPTGFVRGVDDVSFVQDGLSKTDIDRNMVAADLTQTLSPRTFYKFEVQRYETNFETGPVRPRVTDSTFQTFAGFQADEAPLGYEFGVRNSLAAGLFMAGHNSLLRDTTTYTQYDVEFDLTSQIHSVHQLKAGVSFNLTQQDEKIINLDALPDPSDAYHSWEQEPFSVAGYVEDKIEFQGMIANLGVRMDYFDPNTGWVQYDNAFTDAFMGKNKGKFDQMLERQPVDVHFNVSPRVGVSFPVTTASKLFFNYGHFIQTPDAQRLFMVERSMLDDRVWRIANPSAPFPTTISYEIGYEQSLLDQFLVRVSGYYKDIKHQTRWINYQGRQGLVGYDMNMSTNYEDIRGFEMSLYKNVGRWVRGFINYTFMVQSSGHFGFSQYHESRVAQMRYQQQTNEHQQFKPLPQPFGRISLDFLVPVEFGPEIGSIHPFGDWRFNLLGRWKAGPYFTYTGEQSIPGVEDNFQWPDYRMVDARISKNLNAVGTELKIYADIWNLFNIKNFNRASFSGGDDFEAYMQSLRLPEKKAEKITGYKGKFGNDEPGDLEAPYINPPNLNSIRYLFPRSVYFGVRFSF